jgi:YD repeat-containing protein
VAPNSPPALAPNSIPVSRESINGTLAATYAYDDDGSTISITHPDQTVLRYVWDLRNRLVGLVNSREELTHPQAPRFDPPTRRDGVG